MGLLKNLFTRLEPGVTVVVPAHDVERYLGACLDSVLAQTWWDRCRILIVDDGSTDSTGRIADRYAADHPRIEVVHQPNRGPGAGAARNRGLDLVGTEQVLFLDGDDELTPRAIELLSGGLTRHRLDLAVGATEQFPVGREWIWSDCYKPGSVRVLPIEQVPQLVHDARTCNKLYGTAWLRRSGLRFAEGIHHQDTVVNVPAMLRVPRFVLIGDVVHRYRKRAEGGSVMDSHFTRIDNYWDHLQVIETLSGMAKRLPAGRRRLMHAFIVRSFQGFAARAPATLPDDRLAEFFARTKAVIDGIDAAAIEQATTAADQRAAYVTMLEGDLASFRRLDAQVERLRAHRGNLYLDLPTTTEQTRELLRTGATRAWADELTLAEGRLRFRLRLRIRGARRLDAALDGIVVSIADGDRAAAEWPVGVRPDDADPREHSAEVVIPLVSLADGAHLIRLGFLTPTGRTGRWVRRPPDATVEEVGDAGVRVRLGSNDDRAELTVQRAPGG